MAYVAVISRNGIVRAVTAPALADQWIAQDAKLKGKSPSAYSKQGWPFIETLAPASAPENPAPSPSGLIEIGRDGWKTNIYYDRRSGRSVEIPRTDGRNEQHRCNGFTHSVAPGALRGVRGLELRLRIMGDLSAQVKPREAPDWAGHGTMSLYVQRDLDNGRIWSGPAKDMTLGDHIFRVMFSEQWVGVYEAADPSFIAKILENAQEVGVVFGGGPISKGHGVVVKGGNATASIQGFSLIK